MSPMELLQSNVKALSLRKGQYLLSTGEVSNKVYLIKEGVFRHFVVNFNQQEQTIRLSKENDFFFSSIVSFYTEKISYINCQALTDAYVMYWTKDTLEELAAKHEELANFRYAKLIDFVMEKHNRELSLITLKAKRRLEDFSVENQSLFNRIPHHIIASYLNISPETLSRLRAIKKS